MSKAWHCIVEDRPNMETTIHHRRAEIAAKKRSPFRPHRGLAAPDLFLDTILSWRTWKACLIDCMGVLGNIYGNGSQTYHPKGKTYRDAQLRELARSIAIDHMSEHRVVYRSEPAGEKRKEGEIATRQQPPQASGYEAATSSRG
jgi:hypothetical protein